MNTDIRPHTQKQIGDLWFLVKSANKITVRRHTPAGPGSGLLGIMHLDRETGRWLAIQIGGKFLGSGCNPYDLAKRVFATT